MTIRFEARDAIRRTRRFARSIPVATAQELNRQRTQVKGRTTKRLAPMINLKPQRRVRRRILTPKSTAATPRTLRAMGLTLFESFPPRYWHKRAPTNTTISIEPGGSTDRRGRSTVGQPFTATMESGYTSQFRRLAPRRKTRNAKGKRTWLPIRDVRVVSAEATGHRVRNDVIRELTREWPRVWERRMRREMRRAFR